MGALIAAMVVAGVVLVVAAVWLLHGLGPAMLTAGLVLILGGAVTAIVRLEA